MNRTWQAQIFSEHEQQYVFIVTKATIEATKPTKPTKETQLHANAKFSIGAEG